METGLKIQPVITILHFLRSLRKDAIAVAFAGLTEAGRFYFLLQETKKAPSLSKNPFFNMPSLRFIIPWVSYIPFVNINTFPQNSPKKTSSPQQR